MEKANIFHKITLRPPNAVPRPGAPTLPPPKSQRKAGIFNFFIFILTPKPPIYYIISISLKSGRKPPGFA